MKVIATVITLLFFAPSSIDLSNSSKDVEKAYYFMEATCRTCDIDQEGFHGNFYVMSETIKAVDGEIDTKALVKAFEEQLELKFENGKTLFEYIVVRQGDSEKKLKRLHNNYREKYLKRGYHVKLITD